MNSIAFLLMCAGITIGATFVFVCLPCIIGRVIKKMAERLEGLHREE